MLIQFNFKNYNSFRDEAILDLSATKMTEFSDRVVSVGSEKILPVAAIYGANASGKSNVYSAFEYMSKYVINSFKYGDEEKDFKISGQSRFFLMPLRNLQTPVLKYTSLFREMKKKGHITMAFASVRQVLPRNG